MQKPEMILWRIISDVCIHWSVKKNVLQLFNVHTSFKDWLLKCDYSTHYILSTCSLSNSDTILFKVMIKERQTAEVKRAEKTLTL